MRQYKMNPVDKREATRRGTLLLSRECRLIYYTPRRAEFQPCALPGYSRGSEMFLEHFTLFYDDWIKIGGAFQRTKLQYFDVCYRHPHS